MEHTYSPPGWDSFPWMTGQTADLGFVSMITNPGVNMLFMAIVIIIGFAILSFNLQGGLERVTKYMMVALLGLMVVLAVHSMGLSGAKEGLCFYLLPDFSKITPSVVVGAMNQAFFTLSLGIGSMAIFGSYIGKNRTVLAVFENILACIREMTGWSRPKGSIVCAIGIMVTSTTTALGYSIFSFQPFAEGSAWLDLWDFLVSYNLLPLGSLLFVLFCTSKRWGWGWDNFIAEANTGKGITVKQWMKPLFCYVVPVAIIIIYVMGLISFQRKWGQKRGC